MAADVKKTVEIALKIIGVDLKKIEALKTALTKAQKSVKDSTVKVEAFKTALKSIKTPPGLAKASELFEKLRKISSANIKAAASSLRSLSTVNLSKVIRETKDLTNTMEKGGRTARTFGDKIKTVVEFRGISEVLIFLKDSLYAGVAAIVEYDQALKDLQAITGATTREVALMGEKIISVASTTKFSASEVAEGMRIIGQAGFSASESVETMQAVSDLATGTLSTMASTVDLVTTAMRVFQIDASESASIADVFANAVNKSKLTIDKLRTAMNYVGPIAKEAGVSFKELATSMATLANSGLRASTIGTGLRRVFAELLDPSKKLKAAAQDAGVSLSDLDPRATSLASVMQNLRLVLGDAQIAFDVFGKRGAAAALALSSSTAGFQEMLQVISKSGTATKMAATQMEGLGVSWKNLKDKAGVLSVTLGKAGIAGAFKILIDLSRNLMDLFILIADNAFVRFIGKATILTGTILALVAALKFLGTTVLIRIGVAFVQLVTSVTGGTTAIVGFKAALSVLFPIFKAISAVIATVAAGMWLLSDGAKKAAEESLKLAGEYKNLAKYLTDYNEKVANLKENSKELEEANLTLRTKLMNVSTEYKHLAIYALNAINAIDPLTGKIGKNSTALTELNQKIKELEMKELANSVRETNKSFEKQTGFINRLYNSIKDTAKTAKLLFSDWSGYAAFKKLREEAHQFSKELHAGVKNFADLHKYVQSIDHTNLTAQQKILVSQYNDLISSSTELLDNLRRTEGVTLDHSIDQIKRMAQQAGYTGIQLEALLLLVEELQKDREGTFDSTVSKWALEAKEGELMALTKNIEKYKELKGVISDVHEAEIRKADALKQNYVDEFNRLEQWKKEQLDQGNESKEMWTEYYDALDALERKSADIRMTLSKNVAAQSISAMNRELKRHKERNAEIQVMDEALLQTKIKLQREEDTLHEKNLKKAVKNYIDPKELLAAAKEQESILKNSYKQRELDLEISLRKRGESNETIAKELAKLESELTQKVIEIWQTANDKIVSQKDPDSPAARKIRTREREAVLAQVKSIAEIESKALKEKIDNQNQLYKDANVKRSLEHAKTIEEMTIKELERGTSSEEIEKKTLDLTLKFLEDRKNAAGDHFDQAKKLYAVDSEEYLKRQKEFLSASENFYKGRLEYTKKYSQLEYNIEKAKIEAIISLNKAIYDSDSKVQQARITSAKQILQAAYDDNIVTIKSFFSEKYKLQEKDYKEDVSRLIKLRKVQEIELSKLQEKDLSEVERTKTKSRLDKTILDVNTEIVRLQNAQPGLLAKIDAAEQKALDTSNKKIASVIKQFTALKSASDVSLYGSPDDLEKRHAAEKQALIDANEFSLELLKDEVGKNLDAKNQITNAEILADKLVQNLKLKHGKELHDRALGYQDLEFDSFKSKAEVYHALRLKAIEKELSDSEISEQQAEKDRLQAKVDYYNTIRIEAEKHYNQLTKLDSPETHKTRLDIKFNADKQYYEALTDQIIGIAAIQDEFSQARFEAEEQKRKSRFDLDMTKQTEKTKTALIEAKALFDQDVTNTKEYYNKKREIATEAVHSQLDQLDAEQTIFIARMKIRIAEEKDEKKKLELRRELNDTVKKVEESRIKAIENYNRRIVKADADEFKVNERNQEKIKAMIDAAKKVRDVFLRQDSDIGFEDAQKLDLAAFDKDTQDITKKMSEREAALDQIKELSATRKEARDLKVKEQEEALDDHRFEQKRKFVSGMAALTEQMYNAGIISGKKGFAVMQAFAVAEAIVNAQKAASDAYAEGGPYMGPVLAALAYAQGMMRVAAISAQQPSGYAEGGVIGGTSPHSKSDNIDIKATAGEYMQPVKAVKHYGVGVMEAIRNLSIPKEVFDGFRKGTSNLVSSTYALASGGRVPSFQKSNQSSIVVQNAPPKVELTMMNITNPVEMLQHALATPEGQGAILNFMSSRATTIKRQLG